MLDKETIESELKKLLALDFNVELWSKVGHAVAGRCGYCYPDGVQEDMLEFIRKLRESKS